MSNNRMFFKNVKAGHMSPADIFSDVATKHTAEETAQVFIGGTALTTPREEEMLHGWQKPFLFARFFGISALVMALGAAMTRMFNHQGGYYVVMILLAFLVPVTLLLLTWEMNVPRNISLAEVMKIVAVGGILSLIATLVLEYFDSTSSAIWAPLTEEPAKLIIVYLILKKGNHKYILNGMLIGMAVGTGFAVMETLYYILDSFTVGAMDGLLNVMVDVVEDPNNVSLQAVIDFLLSDQQRLQLTIQNSAFKGLDSGMRTAILRALTAIDGHGLWAALYGGALVMAKGKEEISIAHLFRPVFLFYFGVAFLLHAVGNSGFSLGLPVFFEMYKLEYLILTIVNLAIFLPMLRNGVNEIVDITSRLNGGRVTMAVNRGAAVDVPAAPVMPMAPGVDVQLECVAGPVVGQVYSCINGQSLSLGRVAGRCDIALTGCSNVSGIHCSVAVSGAQVTVTDLNSTNGTYVSGQRLAPRQPMIVTDGALIYLGNKSCAFRVRIR